jgi:hypothetical protein
VPVRVLWEYASVGRRNGGFIFNMAGGGEAGSGFRVILRGCPRGSSGGASRLLTVMSICKV